MLEGIFGTKKLRYKHIGVFNNNTAEVTWTQRGASIKSAAVGRLIRVLSIQQQITRVSPLVPVHVTGDLTVHGYIPS